MVDSAREIAFPTLLTKLVPRDNKLYVGYKRGWYSIINGGVIHSDWNCMYFDSIGDCVRFFVLGDNLQNKDFSISENYVEVDDDHSDNSLMVAFTRKTLAKQFLNKIRNLRDNDDENDGNDDDDDENENDDDDENDDENENENDDLKIVV